MCPKLDLLSMELGKRQLTLKYYSVIRAVRHLTNSNLTFEILQIYCNGKSNRNASLICKHRWTWIKKDQKKSKLKLVIG